MLSLTNPDTIQFILKNHNLAPNKFLGQNFLIDQAVLDKIIETANLKAGDNVLEIGPGLGTLTTALCSAGANVVAIEKDKELIPVLEENLRDYKKLKITNDDFLQVDFAGIMSGFEKKLQAVIARSETTKQSKAETEIAALSSNGRIVRNDSKRDHSGFSYKIISNIPYYITSPVIQKIFSFSVLPTEIIFLVQREVAERIAAPAGEMSLISVFVQYHGIPTVVQIVKPESFWPSPKVESAILKITLEKKFKLLPAKEDELWRLAKIGFSSRRKTLANNLAAGFHRKNSEIKELLKKAGFSENTRAQELSVDKWIELLKAIEELK